MTNYTQDQLTVYHKGKPDLVINGWFLERQGVSEAGLEAIKALHVQRLDIEAAMGRARSSKRLKQLFAEWTLVQFDLQESWGFSMDAKFHKFWTVPRCSCPSMDCEDAYPTGFYSINCGCLVHGE